MHHQARIWCGERLLELHTQERQHRGRLPLSSGADLPLLHENLLDGSTAWNDGGHAGGGDARAVDDLQGLKQSASLHEVGQAHVGYLGAVWHYDVPELWAPLAQLCKRHVAQILQGENGFQAQDHVFSTSGKWGWGGGNNNGSLISSHMRQFLPTIMNFLFRTGAHPPLAAVALVPRLHSLFHIWHVEEIISWCLMSSEMCRSLL